MNNAAHNTKHAGQTPNQRINLAFIGSGGWARRYHFPALGYIRENYADRCNLHLRGIYSLEEDKAHAVAAQYGFARVYDSLNALIADDDVNAVAVAISPGALTSVIPRLTARQIPVLSEKPPGTSTAEAQALSEAVTVPNVLAFNRRFIPLNNTFKEIVAGMQDIYYVEGHFLRHARLDETFIIGTGIHWINFMEYVFGEIAHVTVDRFQNPQNETWVRVAHLTFASGLKGLMKFFPCTGTQLESVEVHSNDQITTLHGPLWQAPGKIVIETAKGQRIIDPEATEPLPEVVRLGIVGEYEAFFNTVCFGAPSRSTFQNAVNSMRIAEAIEHGVDV